MSNKSLRSTVLILAGALPLIAAAQQPSAQPTEPVAPSTPSLAFTRADSNGDGKLSKAEAARLPAVAQKFDALDKDKDSQLSMSEYLTAFEAPKQ